MPPSLVSPPVLIYHSSNDATTNADGRRPSVQSVLRAASPLLPPGKQWQVLKLQGKGRKGSGNGAMQHAKLFLLRFGPAAGGGGGDGGGGGGGDNGFLRVVIGSVNLYWCVAHRFWQGSCNRSLAGVVHLSTNPLTHPLTYLPHHIAHLPLTASGSTRAVSQVTT